MFASSCGLTGTEHRVLDLLTQGLSTVDIAREHGVAQSTVLTHVAAIRSKTSSHSVRQLINTLARIPPLAPRALMQ
jgi:DNA-binding CsgD family transcriptional regulator